MYFAIIPIEEPPQDFLQRIRTIDSNAHITQSKYLYFVKSNSGSRYVAESIGFTDKGKDSSIQGIVIPCGKDFSCHSRFVGLFEGC